jgi:hypothetical protein
MDLLKTITYHEDHYITLEKWKKQAEEGKVSKELYRHNGFSRYLSKTTATAIDSPVAHAAGLDVDLDISRTRGGTSKLMLLEHGA